MTMSLPKKIGLYSLLIVTSFIVFFPVIYALMISFMTGPEIMQGRFFRSLFNLKITVKYLNVYLY